MPRLQPSDAEFVTAVREVNLTYERARDHWATCEQCRAAAQKSASLWCEVGLLIMKKRAPTTPHWDTCPRCRQADASVRDNQCREGRSLDDAFQLASERFAVARQLRKSPAAG